MTDRIDQYAAMAGAPHPPSDEREAPTPRWVYAAAAIVVIALVLVLGGMHLFGGGIPMPHQPPR